MSEDKIRGLLSLGEGQPVEFKSDCRNVDAIGKVVCGMLNTTGGYVICGVRDEGEVVGVNIDDSPLADLEKKLHDGLSPKSLVSVEKQSLNGKQVVVIEVPAGQDVPYAFRHVFYIRAGDKNQIADAETIRDVVLRRQIEPIRWERRFSLADVESDLDSDEIRKAVADAERVRRAFFRDASQPSMVLEDFAAAKYGRLTNGGDVLFAKHPAQRLPQIRVRAMRYNTDKAGDTFSDMKSFEGPLCSIFEEAYSFIVRNTPTIARFVKGDPKRHDSPLYPETAVREALINAFVHRDYASHMGGVLIHVFPRRLEIWNAGPFPNGVSVDRLGKGQISVLRNPDIAHVLYMRGLMEKAGRGSVLIVQECEKSGLPVPNWESNDQLGVTLTFFAPEVTPEVTPEVLKMLQAIVGAMHRSQIMEALGLRDEKHFREHYLHVAISAGLIEMTIPDKPRSSNQGYRLTRLGQSIQAKSKS